MYNKPASGNLHTLHLFEHLSPDQRCILAPRLDAQHYHRSNVLFFMGEPADRLYFLQKGTVKISVLSPIGEERILDIVLPGETFGESVLSRGMRHSATAQALSNVTVQTMTREALMELLPVQPDICYTLIHHLVDRQQRLLMRLASLISVEAGPRLLVVLLDLSTRFDAGTDDRYQVPGSLTQEDLAYMVGLNRSTTSSLINDYRRMGILGGQGRTLVVHRAEALAVLHAIGLDIVA